MAPPEHDFEVVWQPNRRSTPTVEALHRPAAHRRGRGGHLIPVDNHTGRATVSSIAIAREVERPRGSGPRRASTPVIEPARPAPGPADLRRSTASTTCSSLRRRARHRVPGVGPQPCGRCSRSAASKRRDLRVGVTTAPAPASPAWKRTADRLFVQVSYDLDGAAALARPGRVRRCGPPAVTGSSPASLLSTAPTPRRPHLDLRCPSAGSPPSTADPTAGVELAATLADGIRYSGAFDGVHVSAVDVTARFVSAAIAAPRWLMPRPPSPSGPEPPPEPIDDRRWPSSRTSEEAPPFTTTAVVPSASPGWAPPRAEVGARGVVARRSALPTSLRATAAELRPATGRLQPTVASSDPVGDFSLYDHDARHRGRRRRDPGPLRRP